MVVTAARKLNFHWETRHPAVLPALAAIAVIRVPQTPHQVQLMGHAYSCFKVGIDLHLLHRCTAYALDFPDAAATPRPLLPPESAMPAKHDVVVCLGGD
jgi:hypothetical protein